MKKKLIGCSLVMLVIHNKIRLVTIPKYWFLIPSLTTLDKMPYHFVVNARIRIGAIKWSGMYVPIWLVVRKYLNPILFKEVLMSRLLQIYIALSKLIWF